MGDTPIETLQQTKVAGDKSPPKSSSIAIIGSYHGKACLFAGDATYDYLLAAIDAIL